MLKQLQGGMSGIRVAVQEAEEDRKANRTTPIVPSLVACVPLVAFHG